MARRSKKEDFLSYPYTPERQLEQPSGWCITGHHDGCRYQFNHGKCGCSCHTKKTIVESKKNSTVSIDLDDPRPWRK